MEVSNYVKDRQNLEAIYRRKKVSVVFSQQPIQPLAQSYPSGSQIQLVFQNSKQFLDLSKVQLFFRPQIQFGPEGPLTQEQRALLCMTITDPQSCFQIQSIQFNGTQIMSQPSTNLQIPARQCFQAYWNNFLSSKPKFDLYGDGDVFSGLSFSGNSGTAYGLVQNAITHPANGLFIAPGYQVGALGNISAPNPIPAGTSLLQSGIGNTQFANSSQFEADPFPRGIVSRMKMYYPDMNFSNPNPLYGVTCFANEYYSQQITNFADSSLGSQFPSSSNLLQFPLMPLGITPSVAVYKKMQEQLQNTRMRFIQTMVTPYITSTATVDSGTLCINQSQGIVNNAGGTGLVFTTGNSNNAPPVPYTMVQDQSQVATGQNLQVEFAQVLMQQGRSVQNYLPGSSLTRATGVEWSSANTTLQSPELFSQCSVSLGDLSCEIKDLGLLAMENLQIVILLSVCIPQTCISAYLQSGLQADPFNSYIAQGAATTCYKQFLDACLIGNSTQLSIQDTTCRIEYNTYEDPESYQIMKALLYQPKPFVSIRQQYDVIPNSGVFTQRLSIGASTMIQGILIFFPAANRGRASYNSSVHRSGPFQNLPLAQDSVVSYQGFQPPALGDLRATYMDSYYMNLPQIYAEVDGQRFASMDLNLANPGLSTYLVTQATLQTTLGKYINLPLQSYISNKFFYWIPLNIAGSPGMRLQDQQITITSNIDDSSRALYARTFNEITQGINGQFGMMSIALTMANLVDCSVVKV